MSQEVDDQSLIAGVAAGDRDALAELYDRYAGSMMALGLRRLDDRQEVEDVLHDVFMEVWRNAHTYESERGSVRAWLFLLMRSRTLDAARKVRRTRTDSLEAATLDHDKADTERDMSDELERARIREVLLSLPQRLRQVLRLAYFRGLTCREVAERIDVPVGTVKSRMRTARNLLREKLLVGRGGRS